MDELGRTQGGEGEQEEVVRGKRISRRFFKEGGEILSNYDFKKGGKTDVSKALLFAHCGHCALPMAEQGWTQFRNDGREKDANRSEKLGIRGGGHDT